MAKGRFKKCRIFKRFKEQETGDVIRWFEGCGNTISVVKGDIPNEAEIRISDKSDSFKIRGSEKLILEKIDKNPSGRINELLERENKLKQTFG